MINTHGQVFDFTTCLTEFLPGLVCAGGFDWAVATAKLAETSPDGAGHCDG